MISPASCRFVGIWGDNAVNLPFGITGFFSRTVPPVDLRPFKKACHEVARGAGWTVESIRLMGHSGNFHRAVLTRGERAVAVVCNAHVPWVAFAEVDDDLALRFVDDEALAAAFRGAMDCEVPGRSFLDSAPEAELLSDLGPAELNQIRHWRPRRVGDIVFHCWD